MTKEQFLKQLHSALNRLSHEERQDIIQDYEEHFLIGLEEGKTEKEIADALGSPNQIAKELLASYHLEKVESTVTTGNIFRAIWAVIGLGFFNLVIVLGPFIALASLILSGWAVSVSFVVSPILVLLTIVIQPDTFEYFSLFFSVLLCGIGLFIGIGMLFSTKAVVKGFVRYLKFNAKLVKGGLKHD
ncbi:HAAS signaling domain-containing protein [Niallia sp. 03133]|uniref:HAAS signaling domain-containing protein n=1 Tax=Niallia sp. 03133 TaxID=3458060 RepID=UPI004044201B